MPHADKHPATDDHTHPQISSALVVLVAGHGWGKTKRISISPQQNLLYVAVGQVVLNIFRGGRWQHVCSENMCGRLQALKETPQQHPPNKDSKWLLAEIFND